MADYRQQQQSAVQRASTTTGYHDTNRPRPAQPATPATKAAIQSRRRRGVGGSMGAAARLRARRGMGANGCNCNH